MDFTHLDESGKVRMVDISEKKDVLRIAVAEGKIKLKEETIHAIVENRVAKGNVLATAIVAGTLAVKKTPELIPMCHPIPLTQVEIDFEIDDHIKAICRVKSRGKTGVEMEALTGVTTALLTIWDMVKSMEKDESGNYPETAIHDIRVVSKEKLEE
ncbi:cyclic pyranopterin monophosphate synthase subunit MoaC [Archaeoglobus sulfaticallidus PM70-1]|uniref:Probable cyclic pyranopterin monophosphate synthase n=1 Tax=Archaeoglobus sulfaticallidus PM70-1 TaxID=387631 RepID=N0BMH1_9EURY|nr:cyclic pyranopterin monophosphate synthase MoaC [Archaeoglobus sulfaticallidus]AGK61460.1 cyclic pyranopterin monophosphate synthase subunit MoaC [Archaeoglobus sulfaticallidus PM70-1]